MSLTLKDLHQVTSLASGFVISFMSLQVVSFIFAPRQQYLRLGHSDDALTLSA